MNSIELFYRHAEKELIEWVQRFSSAHELFENRATLYANLEKQNIAGDVESGVIVDGPVHIGSGALVRSGAVLRGPVVIGGNTVIDSNATLQGGVFVGSNCKISSNVSIIASTCFNDTSIQAGACLDNIMLGSECYVGENCVLGARNIGHEKTTRSTMIGDESFLAAGSMLSEGIILKAKYSSRLRDIIS